MDIKEISLNMYSYGYSAGFIETNEPRDRLFSLESLIQESQNLGLAGIEFPFDRYFTERNLSSAVTFLRDLIEKKIKFFLDFENFDPGFLIKIIPILASMEIDVARIKMDQSGKTIYGGNRFMMTNFDETKELFISKLQKINPYLKEYNFTLAIENHQDLHSKELMEIIEKVNTEHLGINWDVGNSISCIDSPDSFYQNTREFIRNVHLKDYKVFRSEEGIRLVRCPIGSDYVDYKKIFNLLDINNEIETFSVELGAQISRECLLNKKSYWDAYSHLPLSKKSFLDYVNSIISEETKSYSCYELGLDNQQLFQSELDDVYTSVVNLNSLA